VEDQVSVRATLTLIIIALALAGGAGLYCAGKADGGRSVKLQTIQAKRDTNATVLRQAEETTRYLDGVAREAVKRSDARRAKRRARKVTVVDSTTIKLGEELITAEPRVVSIIAEDKQFMAGDSITIEVLQGLNRALANERDAWKQEALLLRAELALERSGRRLQVVKLVGTTVVLTITVVGGILAVLAL
jgi:hypothetical protein